MATDRLYYTDSYLTEFTARVTAVNGVQVQLDRTAFYPTSGGQQFDTGRLGGMQVVDVTQDDEHVTHVLAEAPTFGAGANVTGVVDWRRRFDHMQQHTGQHLLSALLHDTGGAPTVSVHFGDASCTLDVGAALPREAAARIEAQANEIIEGNRPVTVSFEDAAATSGLRKASARSGTLRIVTIDGVDRSACGGTHVRATGEIGPVLVRRVEKYKNLTRVEFLCGSRAVARARADYDALARMAASLTSGIDELPGLVSANAESVRSLQSECRKLIESVAAYRVRELHRAAEQGADGIRRVAAPAASPDELRALGHSASVLERMVFVGTCSVPPTVLLAASADSGVNAGTALKAALGAYGGRGGGNERLAQGTVPDPTALATIVASLMTPPAR